MRPTIATLALLALAAPVISHAQDLEPSSGATMSATSVELARASKLWTSGDHAGAVKVWQSMPQSRDAQYNLGQAYRLGRGVSEDLGMARVFYEKALAAGHPKAAEQLGLLLFNHSSTRASAVPFLEQAAANGSPRADMALGIWNLEDAQTPDLERARVHLTKASDAKIPGASAALAKLSLKAGMDPSTMSDADRSGMAAASVAEAAFAVMGTPLAQPAPPAVAVQPAPVRVAVAPAPVRPSVASMGLPAAPVAPMVKAPPVRAMPARVAVAPAASTIPSQVRAASPVSVRHPGMPMVQVEASDEVVVYSSPSGNYSRKALPADAARPAPVVIWWQ